MLRGEHVHLRPVEPADYGMLQTLELQGEASGQWRYRGYTPSPEEWVRTLWDGVIAQYLMVEVKTGTPMALVYAHRASSVDNHAYFAVYRFEPKRRTPLVMLGLGQFIEHMFRSWGFRTLYAEVAAYNLPQFSSGSGKYFEIEGQLREHYLADGQWWDMFILAVHRGKWDEQKGAVLRAAMGAATQSVRLSLTGR